MGMEGGHLGSGLGERHGQVGGHGALAHAAFARGHGDDVVHILEHLAELLLGVGLRFGGEVDFHLGVAVHHFVDGVDAVVAHLFLHGAGGGGEDEVETYLHPIYLDILNHAEFGEAAAEVGIVNMAEGHLYLCCCNHSANISFSLFSKSCPRKLRASTFPLRSMRTVAGMDWMP